MSEDLVAQALQHLRNRDFSAARHALQNYAVRGSLELQHYLMWGICDLALMDWTGGLATFQKATSLFPHQPQLWFNRGIAEENLGLIDEAVESFEHSLDLKPDQGDACGNLSNLYRKLGAFEDAETMAHKAFELGAPKPQALNALGLALARQGRFDGAEKIFQDILVANPTDAHALTNLANCAVDRLDFQAAWPLFASARAASPEPIIRQEEGMARLLAGETDIGFSLYEARLERQGFLRVKSDAPLWKGESLVGKQLLLVAEQGFGDTIQFCRYGLPFARDGVELLWTVPPSLQTLLSENLPGNILSEREAPPRADYWAPLMSLPWLTGKTKFTDAPPAPYLKAAKGPELPETRKTGRKIGLVWAGSPRHERAYERSMSLAQFESLFSEVPADYFALFTGSALDEITSATPVTRVDNLIETFADTSALLSQLELLITVDTSVAHLAGALGVKTYLLLPRCPDWRWGTVGETTPWYSSMRIVRQTLHGDWSDVIDRLIEQIK